jgi:hypothetical protein
VLIEHLLIGEQQGIAHLHIQMVGWLSINKFGFFQAIKAVKGDGEAIFRLAWLFFNPPAIFTFFFLIQSLRACDLEV